jgi:hypothetical protein
VGRREPGGREEVAKPRADEEKVEAVVGGGKRTRRRHGGGRWDEGGSLRDVAGTHDFFERDFVLSPAASLLRTV